jgi:hypothetical protein
MDSAASLRAIRRIDAPYLRPAKDFGPKPECVWIDIVLLRVDETYQRPIDKQGRAQIIRIAELFDWRKFAPVIVADIGEGLYAIVDGQHRAHAAALCNIRSVPCYVIAASMQEQAECFAAVNSQITTIKTQNLWKARRAAGHDEALTIERIAAVEGVDLVWFNLSTLNMRPDQCCALNAIIRVIRRYGEEIARLALLALRSTRVSEQRSYLTAQWIEAAAIEIAERPEWQNRAHIAAKMAAIDLAAEDAENRAERLQDPKLSGFALACASIFLALGGEAPADDQPEVAA